jgi:predicted glycoside hydrolase/deacetylase ChbG (UPF0249 family)
MRQLIVNADDLGLHPRIDQGIFEAARKGIVTSASVLASGRTAAAAIEQSNHIGLGLGLHLCLTSHLTPCARPHDVRWLAPGGRFRRDWAELSTAWMTGLVPTAEIEHEFRAQYAVAQSLGAPIDHLDTHQHLHLLPGITAIVEGLAIEWNLPLRWPQETPQLRWLAHPASAAKSLLLSTLAGFKAPSSARRVAAIGVHESGRLTEQRLLRLLRTMPHRAVTELTCHPGFEPGSVAEDPTWRYQWEAELAALTSPSVKAELISHDLALTTYASAH